MQTRVHLLFSHHATTATSRLQAPFIGNSSVGESSLLLRSSNSRWLPENETSATVAARRIIDMRTVLF